MQALVVNGRHGDRIYGVCIAVEITLVTTSSTVPTCEDIDRALSTTAIVDSVENSLFYDVRWAFHGFAVVGGTPTAAVNGDILEAIIQGGCLVRIGDGSRENAHTGNFGFVCNAKTTSTILASRDLTGAARAMMVVAEFWGGQVLVVIEVV